MDVRSLFRPNILAASGYVPGEQPQSLVQILKLNTNENSYPAAEGVAHAIAAEVAKLGRYPDPMANEFRKAASEIHGVPADWILACNGSDDALTIITRATCGDNDLMVSPLPTYPLYHVLAKLQGCRFEARRFTQDFQLPANFADGAKLIYVPNPNSPTGTILSNQAMRDAVGDGLFVIDEAYADFAKQSAVELVKADPRFVVTRTFSKSHSLAGLRFGYIIAQPGVIEQLVKVKDSYNVDRLSIVAATAALRDVTHTEHVVANIIATREASADKLSKLGFRVTPSHANFIWFKANGNEEQIYQDLKQRNVLIRFLKFPQIGEQGLRVTIGTDAEMARFFTELTAILNPK